MNIGLYLVTRRQSWSRPDRVFLAEWVVAARSRGDAIARARASTGMSLEGEEWSATPLEGDVYFVREVQKEESRGSKKG